MYLDPTVRPTDLVIMTARVSEDGVDHDPCGRIYLGESAMSEPETRAVANFLSQHNDTLRAYLAYHSFSQYWMLPYSYTKDINPPNFDELVS